MSYNINEITKTIGAFAVTAGAVAGLLLANSTLTNVLPKSVLSVLSVLVTAGVVAGIVFGIRQQATPDQIITSIDKDPNLVDRVIDKGGERIVADILERAKQKGVEVVAEGGTKIVTNTVNKGIDAVQATSRTVIPNYPGRDWVNGLVDEFQDKFR